MTLFYQIAGANRRDLPKVTNLSSISLTEHHVAFLNSLFDFTPTPSAQTEDLTQDIREFSRRLRLSELMYDHAKDEERDDSIVKTNMATFKPRTSDDERLGLFLDNLNNIHLKLSSKVKSNISQAQK